MRGCRNLVADTDLKSVAFGRAGSSPAPRTKLIFSYFKMLKLALAS